MALGASVKAFVDNPKTNFWGALVSVTAEVVSWFSTLRGHGSQPFGQIAFGLTVFFLGRLAWTQYWAAERFRENAKPKFDMVFTPDLGRPSLQVIEAGSTKERRYRVGILSLTSEIVPSVRVLLMSCEPPGNFIFPRHRLGVMDSAAATGERELHPSADDKASLWFDVVAESGHKSRVPEWFEFCYADQALRAPVIKSLHDHEYAFEVVLRAEGGGTFLERTFRISKPWDEKENRSGKLLMLPL